jgi:hypothetical protein
MTTTAVPSAALATMQPVFTDAERVALAGFLAGYRGLTREAYALDLRQFTSWCRARSLALFAVRRADIEGFATCARASHAGRRPLQCRVAGGISAPGSHRTVRNSLAHGESDKEGVRRASRGCRILPRNARRV